MKNRVTLMLIALFFTCSVMAQNVLDNVYVKEHVPTRQVIPYAHLREADVMWSKRIWRVIDLNEKINLPFKLPASKSMKDRRNLIDVIMDAVLEGSLTAYNAAIDDEFTVAMTKTEVEMIGVRVDTTFVQSPDPPYDMVPKVVRQELDRDKVVEYRLKEDWFFDKQRSVMDVRIVGIAPIINDYDDSGNLRGKKPLFWIYFPEARKVFANVEVFNRWNDAERRTLDDIFFMRFFGSFVVKESNVYDRRIQDYKQGLDALLEAQRVKEDIFVYEHDLWEF